MVILAQLALICEIPSFLCFCQSVIANPLLKTRLFQKPFYDSKLTLMQMTNVNHKPDHWVYQMESCLRHSDAGGRETSELMK